MAKKKLTKKEKESLKKFIINMGKHTAPLLTIFFYQLSQGVDWKSAGMVAVYTAYALIGDYFKKLR